MALSNIAHNRMRSFLTILGILIGVTAIIALITIVQGVTSEVTDQFAALGTGKVTVQAVGTELKRGLTAQDLSSIAALENVSGVSPTVSLIASALTESAWEEDATVEGKSDVYFTHTADLVARGRPINRLDVDSKNAVCLMDQAMMEKLFFAEDPIGQSVFISGIEHTVIGVLSDAGSSDVMSQAMGGNADGKIIVPYTDAMRLSGVHNVTSLEVHIADADRTDETIDALEQLLLATFNYKEDSYSVINMQSLLDTMNTMVSLMTALLAGIASIALLVGGIGIMNMMLVSVTERTTEIGLRKALGAEPGQIQVQFLIESFALSLLGGLIGMVLGLLISWVFSIAIGTAFTVSTMAIVLGVGFSAAVGILFGWTPARKASNLNPIDALRSV